MKSMQARQFFAAVVVLAVGAVNASAALVQFNASGGGDWHATESWEAGRAPDKNDTAYFGFAMGSAEATVTFSQDAVAKNINGDALGASKLVFDLSGHTLALNNQSDFKSDIAIINGTVVTPSQGYSVHEGGVLTLGEGAVMKGRGEPNLMVVKDGGVLNIAGGTLEETTAKRNVLAESGSAIKFAGKEGSIQGHFAVLEEGSTLSYALNTTGYKKAPFNVEGIRSLGELELTTAEGYEHTAGEKFLLIAYGSAGRTVDGVAKTFTNVQDGEVIAAEGGARFEINYDDNGTVSLTAVE